MMDEYTWGTGLIITCMDKAFINGLMGANMKVNMLTIKRRDTVSTYIQMGDRIKDNGTKVNSTAKAYLYPLKVKKGEALGKTERG